MFYHGQMVKCPNAGSLRVHSTMCGSLRVLRMSRGSGVVIGGAWGVSGRFPGFWAGPSKRSSSFCLGVKLSTIQWSYWCVTLGWFCESVGGYCAMLLLYRFSKLAFGETVRWIWLKNRMFCNLLEISFFGFQLTKTMPKHDFGIRMLRPRSFVLMEIPTVF